MTSESLDREMDKEHVAPGHSEIVLSCEKNGASLFAETWMGVETVTLRGAGQTDRQTLHDIMHMWNPKELNSCKQRVKWGLQGLWGGEQR